MEAVNLKSLEQLDDAFGGRMLALPALRVQRQFLDPRGGRPQSRPDHVAMWVWSSVVLPSHT
jgi:hypothetical protein